MLFKEFDLESNFIEIQELLEFEDEKWMKLNQVANELSSVASQNLISEKEMKNLSSKLESLKAPFLMNPTPRGGSKRSSRTRMDKIDVELRRDCLPYIRKRCNLQFLDKIESICRQDLLQKFPGSKINQFYNVIFTFPGSQNQPFHCDNSESEVYATLLLNLKTSPTGGGTEFKMKGIKNFVVHEGGVFFEGDLLHRGTENSSGEVRISLVVSFTSDARDMNSYLK